MVRQDAAYGALLRVEKAKLQGVTLTSQTGRPLRLWPPKFHLLTKVSPDGVRIPQTPEPFQAEVLRSYVYKVWSLKSYLASRVKDIK